MTMEVLRGRVGAKAVVCVLALCLLALPEVNTQVTSAETNTQSPAASDRNSTGDVLAITTTTTTTTTKVTPTEDPVVDVGNWKPVPERELLSRSELYAFYQMTMGFLRMIQPHSITTLRYLFDFNDWAKTGENFKRDWQKVVNYGIGFGICALIGALLFIIMPLSGCLIACCRCCGNCGGGQVKRDGPSSDCGRCCCGFTLFALLAFVLTGGILMVLLSFDINAQLTGTQSVFDNISESFHTLSDYSRGSLNEMEKAMLVRFKDTSTEVFMQLDDVIPEVKNETNVTQHLDGLGIFADNLPYMEYAAKNVSAISGNYSTQWEALGTQLNDVRNNVDSVLSSCHAASCNQAKLAIDNMKLQANLSGVELDIFIQAVERATAKNLSGIVSAATLLFNDVFKSANDTLQTEMGKAKDSSKKVEDSIASLLEDIEKIIEPESFESISEAVKEVKEELVDETTFLFIPFWSLLGIAAFVLVTVLFYYIGLLYGVCGKRGDPKRSSCCTWKTGSCWLLVGVVFTYLFYFILIIVLLTMFLVGGLVYTEICRHAYNLPHSEAKGFFDELVQSYMPDNITFILSKTYLECSNNNSLYTSLQLETNGVNLSSIINMDEINKAIDDIKAIDVNVGTVSFLPDEVEAGLLDLGSAMESVSNDVDDWIVEASKALINSSLDDIADLLEIAANETSDSTLIKSSAQQLRDYQSTEVQNLDMLKANLSRELDNLKKYTSQNLTAVVQGLVHAEATLNNTATAMLKSIITDRSESVKITIDNSVKAIKSDVEFEIGRCHPVYDAMSSMINSACVQTLYPLNAYAFALGMALSFLLPIILCAFKLVSLYRIPKPYAAIEDSDRDLYMAYQDNPYYGGKDTHNDMLLHRVGRPKSDYIAMADNPVYTIDDEMPPINIPRAVIRSGTRVLPAQPAAPDDRYFYAMPSHQQRPLDGQEPPPRYTSSPHYSGV